MGGMATTIETSLAGLITPVIGFLAGYAGLSDLPMKIAGFIGGMQAKVLGIVDRVIGFLAEKARILLRTVVDTGQEEAEDLSARGGDVRVEGEMEGEKHTLDIDLESGDVSLASAYAGPAMTKVEKQIDYLEKFHPLDQPALAALKAVWDELDKIQKMFTASPNIRPSTTNLRALGQSIMAYLERYGEIKYVTDINAPIKELPGPEVGTYRELDVIKKREKADGSLKAGDREPHHVPIQELSTQLKVAVRSARDAASSRGTGTGNAVVAILETAIENMSKVTKLDLTSILIQTATHRNSGGTAVHSSSLRRIVENQLQELEKKPGVSIERIPTNDGVAVKPLVPNIKAFLSNIAGGKGEIGQQLTVGLDNPMTTADAVKNTVKHWLNKAFNDSFVVYYHFTKAALDASIIDGSDTDRTIALDALKDHAITTWNPFIQPW